MPGKSTLLALPREIRDEIYLAVLRTPASPPKSPREAGPRFKETCHRSNQLIFYPIKLNTETSAEPLSRCCWQTKHEILDLLQSPHFAVEKPFELDVMVHDRMLWPTWTHVPSRTRHMKCLQVNLRFFKIGNVMKLIKDKPGPHPLVVTLFTLLNRLLHHGTGFIYQGSGTLGLEIDDIFISVFYGSDGKRPELYVDSWKIYIYRQLCKKVHLLTGLSQGVLLGKVQRVIVGYGHEMEEYTVCGGRPYYSIARSWRSYGFVWGPNAAMKVEKVESSTIASEAYNIKC